MSQAAAQASAFYREVLTSGLVWGIRDANGYPAPMTPGGRAFPLWSTRARAERVIATVPAYRVFEVVEIPWAWVIDTLLPDLERDGLRVGVNWTGPRAVGYDLEPRQLLVNVASIDG